MSNQTTAGPWWVGSKGQEASAWGIGLPALRAHTYHSEFPPATHELVRMFVIPSWQMRKWGIRKCQSFAQCDRQRRENLELELTFSHQWPTSLCLISSVPLQFSVSCWFPLLTIYSSVPHPIPSFCFPALTLNTTWKAPSCVLVFPMSSLNRSAL